MAFNGLNRAMIRERVRGMLKDELFDPALINQALERVFANINSSGRYRFQESSHNFNIATGTYAHVFPSGTSFIGEIDVIYSPQTADYKALPKMPYDDALAEGRFRESGIPEIYSVYGDGSVVYVDPIPSAAADGKILQILGFKDITPPSSDISAITTIPSRYHSNLLVYGTVAEINPQIPIRQGDSTFPVYILYQQAFKNMQLQEQWRPNTLPHARKDTRWTNLNTFGNVDGIR